MFSQVFYRALFFYYRQIFSLFFASLFITFHAMHLNVTGARHLFMCICSRHSCIAHILYLLHRITAVTDATHIVVTTFYRIVACMQVKSP